MKIMKFILCYCAQWCRRFLSSILLAPSSVEIFNFWSRLAKRLKISLNDVLMSTLFCESFSLQALLVQKLKISTLDGAKSPGDFFWTIVILHAQIAHLLKSIIVQACTIIFLKSSFQLGVWRAFSLELHF